MKNTKIVLVAQWDGWCGACAVERPLVLTRSGRLGLRTWLTAAVTETRPLTLTCRLCGRSEVVPSEQDDPPVLVDQDEVDGALETPATAAAAAEPSPPPLLVPGLVETAAAPPVVGPPAPATTAVDDGVALDRERGRLGAALGALLAERTAQAGRVTLTPSVVTSVPAVAAPVLPLQRSASDADSLATLQLLADGLDLLSSSRA